MSQSTFVHAGARLIGPRRLFSAALVSLVTLALSGLSAAQSATERDQPFSRTLRIIDTAVRALGDPRSDYRKVLSNALAELPDGAGDEPRTEIRAWLARAPQPGPGFRCSGDFVNRRARMMLLRARDLLLRANPDRIEPAVCYAAPFALDMTEALATHGVVDIYGYDLDLVTPEMIVVTRDAFQDVTSALVAESHTHLVLKLDQVRWPSNSVSLGLNWGHLIRHSIPLVQPTTPMCSSRVETISGDRMLVSFPPRVRGGGSLAPPGTTVWADASLDYTNNKLEARICMTADHPGNDTMFSGCSVEFLHTTDPDWVIDGVLGVPGGRITYTPATRQRTATSTARGQGAVRQWVFSGLGDGNPRDGDVAVTARLNDIRIASSEDNRCISPVAYLEARRTKALGPETTRVLDTQLKSVDTRILRLRPRFAPPL